MFTRLRNAKDQKFATTELPASRLKAEILKLLKREGYIRNYVVRKRGGHNRLKVFLKYTEAGDPSFDKIERVSKPGRRVYVAKNEIPRVAGGMGTAILSTSSGLITDVEARRMGLGGELICKIW